MTYIHQVVLGARLTYMHSREFQKSYASLTSVTVVTDARTGKIIGVWHPGPVQPDITTDRADRSVRNLLAKINRG